MNLNQGFDFSERPFLVIWETTRACDLACIHCRASADPNPGPNELSTDEGFKLIDQVKAMKTPILVFSGGDALKRPDLNTLIRHAADLGIRTGAIPAVTPNLTQEKIAGLKNAGLQQIAFSLDAASPEEHDAFRRVSGVFEHTLECIRWAKEAGLAVQINSLVNVHNLESLDKLIAMIEQFGIVFWEVFFLIPVGRGTELKLMPADQFEAAFEKIYQLNQRVSFVIKITEAPHYRRFCIEKEMAKRGVDPDSVLTLELPQYLSRSHGPHGSMGLAPSSVNAGKGFIFISHEGEVFPSGFLPLNAGNIRNQPLQEIYRNSPLLKSLRDPSLLKGRCGACRYKDLCGGSRSRAYAMTGDYLADDPCCSYQPSDLGSSVASAQ